MEMDTAGLILVQLVKDQRVENPAIVQAPGADAARRGIAHWRLSAVSFLSSMASANA